MLTTTKDDEIKIYEQAILSGEDAGWEASLLSGSEQHTYMNFTRKIGALTEAPSKAFLKEFDALVPQRPSSISKSQLRSMMLFKQIEFAASEKESQKYSKKLNNMGFNYHFNYKRVQNSGGEALQTEKDKMYPSKLENVFREEFAIWSEGNSKLKVLQSMYAPSTILGFKDGLEELEKLVSKDLSGVQRIIRQYPHFFMSQDKIIPLLLKIASKDKNEIDFVWQYASTQQMRKFIKKIESSLITPCFLRFFYLKSFDQSLPDIKDVFTAKQVYLWALSHEFIKKHFSNVKRIAVLRVLYLLNKDMATSAEFFEDYIKDPLEVDNYFSKGVRTGKRLNDYRSYYYLTEGPKNQFKIIKQQLTLLHAEGVDIMRFKKHLKEGFLRKMDAMLKLKSGIKDPKLSTFFKKTELEDLNKESYIKFEGRKLPAYSDSEVLSLPLRVKNVKTVFVQIFEINTIDYCREMNSNIPNDLTLDGLVSVHEKILEFSQPPVVEHLFNFELDFIKNFERGVYVINFLGDGVSSRAVLRRGKLRLIKKTIRTGYECKIIDENGKICKSQDQSTGLYIGGSYHPCDLDGYLSLSFNQASSEQVVISHQNFGYFTKETFAGEKVRVKGRFLYNEETFLPGNRCSILLDLKFFLNNFYLPRTNMEGVKVVIVFEKENGQTSEETLEGLSLSEDKETEIGFYLPARTTSIKLKASCSYDKLQTDSGKPEKKEASISHNITLLTRANSTEKTHIFLQRRQEGYAATVRGKNGEGISNIPLSFIFRFTWKDGSQEQKMLTNELGEVNLGPLEGIWGFKVTSLMSGVDISSNFIVKDQVSRMESVSENHTLVEGQIFELPVVRAEGLSECRYRLVSCLDDRDKGVKEDISSKITIIDDFVRISDLETGIYQLVNLMTRSKHTIRVIKNEKIEEGLYQDDRHIYQMKKFEKTISNVASSMITSNSLQIKLDNVGPDTRVHVFNSTFNDQGLNYNGMSLNLQATRLPSELVVNKKTSEVCDFIDNYKMPAEMLYAIKRRQQSQALGISSEKPKIFIKTQEAGKAIYKQEQQVDIMMQYDAPRSRSISIASDDDEFSMSDSSDDDLNSSYSRPRMRVSKKMNKKRVNKKKKGGKRPKRRTQEISENGYLMNYILPSNSSSDRVNNYEAMRSFLKNPSILVSNLKPDPTSKIVDISLKDMQGCNLRVYIVNPTTTTQATVYLPGRDRVDLRSQTLQTSKDASKTFAYQREIYSVKVGESQPLPSYRNSELEIVDSIQKIFKIMEQYAPGEKTNEDNWSKLKDWDDLDFNDMIEYIDKNFSHELSFFIFMRDPEIFETVLLPFIRCKTLMSFMDYVFLKDQPKILEFLVPEKLVTLNPFEKVVLISVLPEEYQDQKQSILQLLEGEDCLNNYSGDASFESVYDKLLNNKTSKNAKIQLKQVNTAARDAQKDYSNFSATASESGESNNTDDFLMMPQQQQQQMNFVPPPMLQQQQMNFVPPPMLQQQQMNFVPPPMLQQQQMNFVPPPQQLIQRIMPNQSNRSNRRMRNNYLDSNRTQSPSIDSEGFSNQNNEEDLFEECEQQQMMNNVDFNNDFDDEGTETDKGFSDNEEQQDKYDMRLVDNIRNQVKLRRVNLASLKNTKVFGERQYLLNPNNIRTSKFWVDLARYLISKPARPFLSHNFIYCSMAELPLIAAYLDLDLISDQYQIIEDTATSSFSLSVKSNSIVLQKYLKEQEGNIDDSNSLLIAQKWFDGQQRTVYDQTRNRQVEKKVDYFLKGKVYGSQLVISNVSSIEQQLQVITEVPQGSIPLSVNNFHQNFDLKVPAFSTHKIEIFFYFPAAGEYSFCPASVTCDGRRVSVACESSKISVMARRPEEVSLENVADVVSSGDKSLILDYLRTRNIQNSKLFRFSSIFWLLKSKIFFKEVVSILRKRLIFDEQLWGFGFYHGDLQCIAEILIRSTVSNEGESFMYLRLGDKIIDNFSIKEFKPIINSRFHQLGDKETVILNVKLRETYVSFLKYLFSKSAAICDRDWLFLAYYLVLQDRITEAISVAKRIDEAGVVGFQIQYDYMMAFFDMYESMPRFERARKLCEKNVAYPIAEWRDMFVEIANQISEFDGEKTDQSKKAKGLDEQAQKLHLKAELAGKEVKVVYKQVESIKFEFFEIDLEILFSVSPFLEEEFQKLVYVKPIHSETQRVVKTEATEVLNFALPDSISQKNMVVKVSAQDGTKAFLVYSSTRMTVTVDKEEGSLKVSGSVLKAIPRVYVKCFAKMSRGGVEFFKDGYTDIRGSFQYFDKQGTDLSQIQRFALFVSDKEMGSIIQEVECPQKLKVEKVHELNSLKWQNKQSKMNENCYGQLIHRKKMKRKRQFL